MLGKNYTASRGECFFVFLNDSTESGVENNIEK